MDRNLLCQALSKVIIGFLIVGLLIFLPAGTLDFWNGWLLISILFIPMFGAGLVMMFRNPDLLRKRLNVKEKESDQKKVIALSGMLFLAVFITAGLNFRWKWMHLPDSMVWAAAALFLLFYLLYAEVLRENAYLSRTVEVQEGQKVIDTGLYGLVRHPMYMVTLGLFLSMPIVLGSPFSFLIMLLYIPIICARIRNEEKVLTDGLEGYAEYKTRVKYRLIPYIW